MIKKEAAKIIGRKGKGQKRQKKKEALVGVRYKINANIRTADDVARNLVYPEQKEGGGNEEKQEKASDIRYIASISKPKNEIMNEICEEVRNEDFSETPLLCLMDGSAYLWKQLRTVFRDIENKVCILDIIHVSEYIWLIAHLMFREGSDNAKAYVFEKLKLISEGNIASYIMELQAEMLSGKWKKASHQEKFRKVITYFKNHRQYMKYDEYLSAGYPIGTGIVESACGHLVRDRMEISGARWSIDGAEPILRLRSVVKSDNWDEYWEFLTSQARENIFIPDGYNPSDIKEKQCA
jgi:signal recognition particle subunit SEC65